MSLLNKLFFSQPVQKFLYNRGYTKELDVIRNVSLNVLDPQDKENISRRLDRVFKTGLWKDINSAAKEVSSLDKDIKKAFDKVDPSVRKKTMSFLNNLGAVGYEPAGSVLKRLYPNPFQPYSFLGDNYWAADKARREFRVEVDRDSYVLVANDRTSKREIKAVNQILDILQIPLLWTTWVDHLNTFANIWLEVDDNLKNNITPDAIKMLLPEKVVPEYDRYQENVIAWKYITMGKEFVYPIGSLDHIQTYSLRSFQMGSPSLTSLIVEIEADMHATIFNNTFMQKGGLIRGVLSIAAPDGEQVLNEQSYIDYANIVQEKINKQNSGVRGGGQLLAMYGIDKFFDMGKANDINGLWDKTSDRTAARVAMMFGVSPERLGINNYSQYKNDALVADSIALSLDNNQYYLTGIIADYINKRILKDRLGIENITIQASGQYGAVSKAAAQFAQLLAQAGAKIMTVDEFRTKCLHWEPLGGTEGQEFIGSILEKQMLAKQATTAAKAIGPVALNYCFGNRTILKHYPKIIRSAY